MNLETTFLNDNNLSLNITFTQANMLYDDIVNNANDIINTINSYRYNILISIDLVWILNGYADIDVSPL